MMTNLFSSFDPSSYLLIPMNWISVLTVMILMTPLFWFTPNKSLMMVNSIFDKLHQEFNTLLGTSSSKGSSLPFISLFLFILLNNFLGLFPYIFTASSHMALTLSLSLPLWISFMLYGWINYTKFMFAHLVPMSTPPALMPLMVVIESVSNIIRPLTLAVRLMANMVAGHLLMTLLGNQSAVASGIILVSVILTQMILLTLESAVAIIQSYVFAVLSTLYASEITSH